MVEKRKNKIPKLEQENKKLKLQVKKLKGAIERLERSFIEDEFVGCINSRKFLEEQVYFYLRNRVEKMGHDLIHDELTGLKTRKYLVDRVKAYLKSLFPLNDTNRNIDKEDKREHVGFLFCDIDRFKSINDTLGHAAGDEVLKEVSRTIESSVCEKDIVARFGGEEILIALLEARTRDSIHVAEKIRKAVEDLTFEEYPDLHVTISIGVVSTEIEYEGVPNKSEDRIDKIFDEYVRRSDSAVYIAKDRGRNRVVVWHPELGTNQHSSSFRKKLLKVIKERREK